MKLFCFNVIEPVGYGKQKHTVKLCITMAETMEAARALVASERVRLGHPEELITYRNDFEGDEVITWSFQYWSKADVKAINAKPVTEYARG